MIELELIEQVTRPTIGIRRLADHQAAADTCQAMGHSERPFRRTEPAGDHGVERSWGSERIDVGAHHRDTIGPAEPRDDASEEVGPLGPSIQQGDLQVGPIVGDHQPGNAAAGSEIEYVQRRIRRSGIEALEGAYEVPSVFDDLIDGAIAEEPQPLRRREDIMQGVIGMKLGTHGRDRSTQEVPRRSWCRDVRLGGARPPSTSLVVDGRVVGAVG